jgi:hypothetical protein
MTHVLWSQDFFAKGELSPLMYSRVTIQAYYQGLKTAKNVLCFPQGSAGKRFGTKFLFQLQSTSNYKHVYFESFQYLNECCYLVLFTNNQIDIYLEGELIAIVAATGILADEVQLIDHTILENRFRVTTGIYRPKDLTRSDNAPEAITAFGSNTLTVGTVHALNSFFPARFTTTGSLPVTVPQIHLNKTYFVRFVTTTTFKIYSTAEDAAANVNAFAISSVGVNSNLVIRNTWTFGNVAFRNLPVFDFTGGYDTSTFTPAAQTGYGIVITRTAGTFNFTAAYVGGVFSGNGGIARITATNGTNQATVDIVQPFTSTAAIPGTQAFIAEHAWSDARGWPRKCSSFQNRAFFANTDTLSNGLWGSVVNDFDDFNDIESSEDHAISWFPTSDTVNFIQFIVPYRSLTIHTNSGVYSTPLSVETAITQSNFSLALQDSTPADAVQPQGLDNQIIVLSGNDAHSLLWDGFNNAYTSSIISIANEQLIRTPLDEAAYVDRVRAGSRYMFITNLDGSLAIYQSLIAENVSGFTRAVMEQSYGNAYFRWVTSNFDGRAWFIIERELAAAGSVFNLIGNTSDTFSNSGYGFPTDTFTAVLFAGTTLPVTTPQIEANTYYWAVGTVATDFKVYLSQEDALADENPIQISDFGTSATVQPYPLETKLLIEQLDFDAYMDCVGYYPTPTTAVPPPAVSTIPVSQVTGTTRFNAQEVLMQGDGFGFETIGVNQNVVFEAHGVATPVSDAQYGFPINVEIIPLPLSLSMTGNPKSSILIEPKHIRFVTFLFADTVGGNITQAGIDVPIAIKTLEQITPGLPPEPLTGSFEMSVFGAWDDFNVDSFTINHTEPFGMKLTGIFYKLDA